MKTRITPTLVLEQILDLWADNCIGSWRHVINLKDHKTYVELTTLEGSTQYPTLAEAAHECLYTIGEWLKEA